jgi:hypothetical protein
MSCASRNTAMSADAPAITPRYLLMFDISTMVERSCTFMNRQGWLLSPEGAHLAASSSRSRSASDTGSPVNSRTLLLPAIASNVSILIPPRGHPR